MANSFEFRRTTPFTMTQAMSNRFHSKRVAHGGEAAAMPGTRAKSSQRREVLRRPITLVTLKAVLWILLRQRDHEAVTVLFRDDGCRTDWRNAIIAANDRKGRQRQLWQSITVDEYLSPMLNNTSHRALHSEMSRLQDIQLVDLLGSCAAYMPADGVVANLDIQLASAFGRELFGIPQAFDRALC